MIKKGIILAGGSGTRLDPLTRSVSKQLLPIYNKPLIYYPLSILMLSGIKDILIITTPDDKDAFNKLLGDGSHLGIKLSYAIQPEPGGLAQAFLVGEKFIDNSSCALVLGDNIYYGHGMYDVLQQANINNKGASVFGYHVEDPTRYGVVSFGKDGKPTKIVEKPTNPESSIAVTGLYFYDETVVEKAKSLKPSHRGELEITDLNELYLAQNTLDIVTLGRGYAWFDAGTFESMLEASVFIRTIERRQNLMVGLVEEIAYRLGYINKNDLENIVKKSRKSPVSLYLESILNENS